MKKQVLFAISVCSTIMLNAQDANRIAKIPSNLKNVAVYKNSISNDKMISPKAPFQTQSEIATSNSLNRVSATTEAVIGHTYYDLQTNSSIGDRIVLNADGTIATCWTFENAQDNGSYANRGTGYAYFNGTAWSTPATARVENARVGWGNVVNTRSGKEVILSHNGSTSKMHLSTRNAKGSGTWSDNETLYPSANAGGNFWPRMVTSSPQGGDTIYAIAVTYPVASGGTLYQGLDGAIVFSRSTNAGASWDIVNQIPAGLTSATFRSHGPDSYAISAKGSTVVIATGDIDKDVVYTKSTDGGVTWSAKTVFKFE